jgi:hypothetical protein
MFDVRDSTGFMLEVMDLARIPFLDDLLPSPG